MIVSQFPVEGKQGGMSALWTDVRLFEILFRRGDTVDVFGGMTHGQSSKKIGGMDAEEVS